MQTCMLSSIRCRNQIRNQQPRWQRQLRTQCQGCVPLETRTLQPYPQRSRHRTTCSKSNGNDETDGSAAHHPTSTANQYARTGNIHRWTGNIHRWIQQLWTMLKRPQRTQFWRTRPWRMWIQCICRDNCKECHGRRRTQCHTADHR